MSWNYRVVKNEFEVGIKEVYYNKDGSIYAMTEDFVYPVGDDYEEFSSSMNMYIEALSRPVLDESEAGHTKTDWNNGSNFEDMKETLLDEAWEDGFDEDDFDDGYHIDDYSKGEEE